MIGLRQWQHDAEEDAELAGPVETGRLEQLVGDADHELPHHEDAERLGGTWQDDAPRAVQEAEPCRDEELGDQDDLDRDHQRAQDREEQHVPAGKAEFREGVAAEQVGEHGE